MATFLYLLAIAVSVIGVSFFGVARSAIHEIQGLLCFLISAVLFIGGAIVYAVQQQRPYAMEHEKPPVSPQHSATRPQIEYPAPPVWKRSRSDPAITALTPATREEAQQYMAALETQGYRLQKEQANLWEIVAPQGGTHFVYSLHQLRELAHRAASA